MHRVCSRFSALMAALIATVLASLALTAAAEAAELEIADAGGVTLAFEGDIPADSPDGFRIEGAVTVGLGPVRTALAEADLTVTLVDGRVDTLVGHARLNAPSDGVFDQAAFDLARGSVGLAYGDQLDDLELPLQPATRYVFVNVGAGPHAAIGTMAFDMGAEATLVLDPRDPALYARGAIDGFEAARRGPLQHRARRRPAGG